MKVFIPIRSTEILNDEVKNSILNQSEKADIELIVTTPSFQLKRKGEFEARDLIVNKANNLLDKYVVVNDSDTSHLYNNNFKHMIEFLNNNEKVGAVVLWNSIIKFKEPIVHYRLACTMFRTEILKQMPQLNIEGSDFNKCCCIRYKQKIEELGYQISYIDDIKRISELK